MLSDRVECRLVQRHGADAGGCFGDHGAADLVDRTAGGEVHDGVGAACHRHAHLFKFLLEIEVIGGAADVGVDLGPKAAAYGERGAVHVLVVMADDDVSRGDPGADEFGIDPFSEGGCFHLVSDDPLAGVFELRHGCSFIELLFSK